MNERQRERERIKERAGTKLSNQRSIRVRSTSNNSHGSEEDEREPTAEEVVPLVGAEAELVRDEAQVRRQERRVHCDHEEQQRSRRAHTVHRRAPRLAQPRRRLLMLLLLLLLLLLLALLRRSRSRRMTLRPGVAASAPSCSPSHLNALFLIIEIIIIVVVVVVVIIIHTISIVPLLCTVCIL